MKYFYAVKFAGTSANTGGRHCAEFFRFKTSSERDEWVNDSSPESSWKRESVKASDAELKAAQRSENMDWSADEDGFESKSV